MSFASSGSRGLNAFYWLQKVSEYDQEISQSHTADQLMAS